MELIKPFCLAILGASFALLASCHGSMNDPSWATQPFPKTLHTTQTDDMQVFRDDTDLQIVNTSPQSYSDFNLWINQRYVQHVNSLPAGGTITVSLWEFYDEYGDRFNAGGFFRAYEPTPVRMVQIQPKEDGAKLRGLITIRRENIILPPEPGR